MNLKNRDQFLPGVPPTRLPIHQSTPRWTGNECENASICEKVAKCEKMSTLNVAIDARCENITLNVNNLGSLNVQNILTLNVFKSTQEVQTLI